MANELCASGFGSDVDGQYNLMSNEHWQNSNGKYWIYKDSFFWMISTSEFFWDKNHIVAIKAYVPGSWANGTYNTPEKEAGYAGYIEGTPMGSVSLGTC